MAKRRTTLSGENPKSRKQIIHTRKVVTFQKIEKPKQNDLLHKQISFNVANAYSIRMQYASETGDQSRYHDLKQQLKKASPEVKSAYVQILQAKRNPEKLVDTFREMKRDFKKHQSNQDDQSNNFIQTVILFDTLKTSDPNAEWLPQEVAKDPVLNFGGGTGGGGGASLHDWNAHSHQQHQIHQEPAQHYNTQEQNQGGYEPQQDTSYTDTTSSVSVDFKGNGLHRQKPYPQFKRKRLMHLN